jgi:hypothetical protein
MARIVLQENNYGFVRDQRLTLRSKSQQWKGLVLLTRLEQAQKNLGSAQAKEDPREKMDATN